MPRQKSNKNTSEVKLGESYTSLFLGIIVVIVVAVLIVSFIKHGKNIELTQSTSTVVENLLGNQTSYIVKDGDSLWTIAEKVYGSGYNWINIVSANNIENPNILFVGTKLSLPNVKSIVTDKQENNSNDNSSIKNGNYIVKQGDCLWNIALRAYGDGYKWSDLAKNNNIKNPDFIYPGEIVKIAR
jgi:nucleoid-associated protein YgaU